MAPLTPGISVAQDEYPLIPGDLGGRVWDETQQLAASFPAADFFMVFVRNAIERTNPLIKGIATKVVGPFASALFWTTASMMIADWTVEKCAGKYDVYVMARMRERLQQKGLYNEGALGYIEKFLMPTTHDIKVAAGIGTYATESQIVGIFAQILQEDRELAKGLREALALGVTYMLSSEVPENVIALLSDPADFGVIEPALSCKISYSLPEKPESYSACSGILPELSVVKDIGYVMKKLGVNDPKDEKVYEAIRKMNGLDVKQYRTVLDKMHKQRIHQQIAFVLMLNPDGFAGREKANRESDPLKEMFTAEGVLKPKRAKDFIAWARASEQEIMSAQRKIEPPRPMIATKRPPDLIGGP